MRLLLVGASGFLGRNLTAGLDLTRLRIDSLVATYRSDSSFPSFAAALGDLRIEARRYDLLADDPPADCDVALYVAGNANHTLALDDPVADLRANAEAMARFLKGFRGYLVLLSTGAVYHGHVGRVSPRSTLAPRFPYAVSKLAAEHYARTARHRGQLAGLTIVRFYYAWGPHEPERRLIRRLLTGFAEGRPEVVVNGDGGTLMQPMYVDDFVAGLQRVVAAPSDGVTVDLCGPPRTLLALTHDVAAACGVEPSICHRETAEEPIRWYSTPGGYARLTGFRPSVSIPEGIARYRAWLTAQ